MKGYVTDCDFYLRPILPIEGLHIPSEQEIFGSTVTVTELPAGGWAARSVKPEPLTGTYTYQGIVLAVFVLLFYMIYSYRSSLSIVGRMAALRLSVEKVYEEYPLYFRYFLNHMTLLGGLLLCGLLVRYSALSGWQWNLADFPVWVNEGVVWGLIVLIVLILGYRRFVTWMVSNVIQNEAFFAGLRLQNRIYAAMGSMVVAPLFLVVALTQSTQTAGLMQGIGILLGLFYLAYLMKSYHFFVRRDVSILQWILYLCAVEFFPISLLVLLALRYTQGLVE
ncbi:MAG: DUF4271 domain-containing protein [Alistipes sp.]|nr:DUF4271 domain-containing protein [Alistipes sp.]